MKTHKFKKGDVVKRVIRDNLYIKIGSYHIVRVCSPAGSGIIINDRHFFHDVDYFVLATMEEYLIYIFKIG